MSVLVSFDTHTFRFLTHISLCLKSSILVLLQSSPVCCSCFLCTVYAFRKTSVNLGASKENKRVGGKKTKGKKGDICAVTKNYFYLFNHTFITPIYGSPLLASLTLFSSLFLTLAFHPFVPSKPHTFFFLHKLSLPLLSCPSTLQPS